MWGGVREKRWRGRCRMGHRICKRKCGWVRAFRITKDRINKVIVEQIGHCPCRSLIVDHCLALRSHTSNYNRRVGVGATRKEAMRPREKRKARNDIICNTLALITMKWQLRLAPNIFCLFCSCCIGPSVGDVAVQILITILITKIVNRFVVAPKTTSGLLKSLQFFFVSCHETRTCVRNYGVNTNIYFHVLLSFSFDAWSNWILIAGIFLW